jgi:hypothetical protein
MLISLGYCSNITIGAMQLLHDNNVEINRLFDITQT